MIVLDWGHHYEIEQLDNPDESKQKIVFVKRYCGFDNHPGTTNQELLRVLISRVQFLENQLSWIGNEQIIHHLRMALVLHEARALIRKVEKHQLNPENIAINKKDGHFILTKI